MKISWVGNSNLWRSLQIPCLWTVCCYPCIRLPVQILLLYVCRDLSMKVLSVTVSTLHLSTLCLYHVHYTVFQQDMNSFNLFTSSASAMPSAFAMVRLLPSLKNFWADIKCMLNIKRLTTSISSMSSSYSHFWLFSGVFSKMNVRICLGFADIVVVYIWPHENSTVSLCIA